MPALFRDEDRLFYLRFLGENEVSREEKSPFWRKFIALGASMTEISTSIIKESVDDGEESQEKETQEILYILRDDSASFFDQDSEGVLAIDLPFPINQTGAPKEKVLDVLRSVIGEEEISELFENILIAEGSNFQTDDISHFETQFIEEAEDKSRQN